MSFTGLNVTFGFILKTSLEPITPAPIYGPSTASQNMAAPGTSTVIALAGPNSSYTPAAFIYAAVDSWITFGPSPADPSADMPLGGRHFIQGGTPKEVFVAIGDKFRWAIA